MPIRDKRWVSRRDDTFEAALDEVTWVNDDRVRYLDPEVALLFKARQQRRKDDLDLGNALPLLTARQRGWLSDAVQHMYGDHDGIARLDSDG